MSEEKKSKEEFFFEDIVKKSKTGISLLSKLLDSNSDLFIRILELFIDYFE